MVKTQLIVFFVNDNFSFFSKGIPGIKQEGHSETKGYGPQWENILFKERKRSLPNNRLLLMTISREVDL
ncbi:hypothetical protein [Desulforamulus ruminis]|uniref:hypothetical protein n=1 Tax=Desulforamulus ruminis TaxID=1564 RepID=UPI001651100B|nr:hypothetical protein [Desulforamulus ruminis]